MKSAIFAILASAPLAAFAVSPSPAPYVKSYSQSESLAVSVAAAAAAAAAEAAALAASNSSATGGNSSATGGAGGNSNANATGGAGGVGGVGVGGNADGGDSAAVANNQITIEGDRQIRQAPAIGQGSFAIQGCGVAGNAGGSSAGGAAFLGVGFTSAQCYDFMLAQAFASVGEQQAACAVLNVSRAGRRAAARGVVLPTCTPVAPVVLAAPAPDMSAYVTRDELAERERRQLQRRLSK